jgi:uncharacterized protein
LDPRAGVDPWRAVRGGFVFAGEAGAADLPRLAEALAEAGGGAQWPARFELEFARDGQRRAVARGRVALSLRLVCQRCLGELIVPADCALALGLVRNDAEADELPESLDPWPVGESVRPLDLVEDELLLALPQVPMHPPGACTGPAASQPPESAPGSASAPVSSQAPTPGSPPAPGPFAVLARLKESPPERQSPDGQPGPVPDLDPGLKI